MNETQKIPPRRLSAIFAPPRFEDDEKTRVASLLNFITLLYFFVIGLSFLAVLSYPGEDVQRSYTALLVRVVPYFIALVIIQVTMRRGHVTGAARFFVFIYWLNVAFEVLTNGGISAPSFTSFLVAVLIAGLFMGYRVSILIAVLSILAGIGIAYLEGMQALPASFTPPGPVTELVTMGISMISVVGLLRLYLGQMMAALKGLRSANQELKQSGLKQEQQVIDRTRALATSVEVSRRLSTILDHDRLVSEVVNELQAAFGYYHVHIYLYDRDRHALLMAGGTGEAGRSMLARGHRIETGQGLVGRAAQINQTVVAQDVAQEPGWLPNPLLPETRAEVAVPITIGNEVLGVLDVQQNTTPGFVQQDIDLLHSIGNQVAIALQNARVYMASQRQAQREAFVAALNQKIQSATSIDEVLQVAVSNLSQALGAQRAIVELRSPETTKDSQTSSSEG